MEKKSIVYKFSQIFSPIFATFTLGFFANFGKADRNIYKIKMSSILYQFFTLNSNHILFLDEYYLFPDIILITIITHG